MSDDKHLVCTVAGILTGATGGGMFGAGLADIAQMPVKGGALLWGGVMAIICGLCGLAIADEREKRPKVTHYRDLGQAFNADTWTPPKERIEFHVTEGRHTRLDYLPIGDYDRVRLFADIVCRTQGLRANDLTPSSTCLSRDQWDSMRALFVKHGLAVRQADGQVVPTEICLRILRKVAEDERPTPRGEFVLRLVFPAETHANAKKLEEET